MQIESREKRDYLLNIQIYAMFFNIDLSHVGTSKEEYKEKIENKISKQMYYRDLKID